MAGPCYLLTTMKGAGAPVLAAILTARSLPLTDIAQAMASSPMAHYERLLRFLAKVGSAG